MFRNTELFFQPAVTTLTHCKIGTLRLKISKVLSFVLILAFVLKHNLSKAAWTDLLRLLAALLGEWCKKAFQSVYKMQQFMKDYFGSKEPTKIAYCANCFNQVESRCQNAACRGASVSNFLDLHFEEKVKDLFKDSEFLKLLKKGKEQIKRTATNTIRDIYHGLDYKNFIIREVSSHNLSTSL